ncbi:MAG: hypothetical protein HY422_02070 [Candidatus Komeilibacteria bacterium]|nr:hypothetical protein [Candidatus Komeilibacteria bacterium]
MNSADPKIIKIAVVSAVGVFAYVGLISWVLIHGEQFFGSLPRGDIRGPMLFLMLFVFSALVTGLMVLGRPTYLFLTGSKKEALTLLGYTVAGLFVLTFLIFAIIVLV